MSHHWLIDLILENEFFQSLPPWLQIGIPLLLLLSFFIGAYLIKDDS